MIQTQLITPKEKFSQLRDSKVILIKKFIELGELLSNIKRTAIYKVLGYEKFKAFIENEFSIASSTAAKLIDLCELFSEELDLDDDTLQQIGNDKLDIIKPLVKNSDIHVADYWVERAKELSIPDLRERVKIEKEKNKKALTIKELYTKQFYERLCVYFNCSVKELNFKIALYLMDEDLNSLRIMINEKEKRFKAENGEPTQLTLDDLTTPTLREGAGGCGAIASSYTVIANEVRQSIIPHSVEGG